MPARVSEQNVQAILRSYFEGLSSKEVANRHGYSARTAQNKLQDFKKRVKEVGIRMASSEKNLNINQLLELAKDKQESKLSFDELREGSRIAKTAKKMGIKMPSLEDGFSLFHTEILTQGHQPKEFIANAYELKKAREELKLPYEAAVKKYKQLKEDTDELVEEKKRHQKELDEIETELNEAHSNAEITREDLGQYVTDRETLLNFDLYPMMYLSIARILKNFKQQNEDPKALIEFYKNTEDAEQYKADLETKIRQQELRKSGLEALDKSLKRTIDEQKKTVEAAKIFSEAGIETSEATQIAETVKQIAAKHGTGKNQAVKKLSKDLEDYYDPLIGFEARLNILIERCDSKKGVNEDLIERNSMLRIDNKEILNTVIMLKKLVTQGVRNNDIMTWGRILEENNLDPATLRSEMKKLDGLPGTVRNLRREEIQLRTSVQSLGNEVEASEYQRNNVRAELQAYEKDIESLLNDLLLETIGIVNVLEEKIFNQETGFTPRAQNMVDGTMKNVTNMINKATKNWDKAFNKMEQTIDDSAVTVTQLEERTFEAGKVIGQLVNLESVTRLAEGKLMSHTEANIAILSLSATMMNHLYRNNQRKSQDSLLEFLKIYTQEAEVDVQF